MCQPLSEGGQRCASHTRPPFNEAIERLNAAQSQQMRGEARAQSTGDVVAHASTRTGADDIEHLKALSEANGDWETAAWFQTCLRLGQAQRDASADIRHAIRAQREQNTVSGPVTRGTVLYLGEGATTHWGYMRRGTYVRVHQDPAAGHRVPSGTDRSAYVEVIQLPFRREDTERVKRGGLDGHPGPSEDNRVYTIPRTALRTPQETDQSAAYYRARPHYWEGGYYTEQEVQQMMSDMDEDERIDFEMDLYRNS